MKAKRYRYALWIVVALIGVSTAARVLLIIGSIRMVEMIGF